MKGPEGGRRKKVFFEFLGELDNSNHYGHSEEINNDLQENCPRL